MQSITLSKVSPIGGVDQVFLYKTPEFYTPPHDSGVVFWYTLRYRSVRPHFILG